MTLVDAVALFDYWETDPPEHELVAMLSRVYTTWGRYDRQPRSVEEHRASLELRWRTGQAMNVKQLFDAQGIHMATIDPNYRPPGIGPFPGAPRPKQDKAR